jgi:hypothetical protein
MRKSVVESHDLRNKGCGIIYVDSQPCNRHNYYRITDALKSIYQVSRSVVRIRLKKLGVLKEAVKVPTSEPGAARALDMNGPVPYEPAMESDSSPGLPE